MMLSNPGRLHRRAVGFWRVVVSTFDVAVIGLGAMGSASLFNLARRGLRVIGLEQFGPGTTKARPMARAGPSACRISSIRRTFRSRAAPTRMARARGPVRQDHPDGDGHPRSGLARIGRGEGSRRSVRLHGLEHELLDASEINRAVPGFSPAVRLDRPVSAAGRVSPARTRRSSDSSGWPRLTAPKFATRRRCSIELVQRRNPHPHRPGVIEAGSVVVTAGGWIGEFAPELRSHLHLTRQVLGWFSP